MRSWPRTLFLWLSLVLLLGFAYSPVLSVGLLGSDYAVLARTAAAGPAEPWAASSPLGQASLRVSRALWGIVGPGPLGLAPAFLHRLENLVLLLLAALGGDRFVRRLLLPWIGSEQARSAGHTAALCFVFHPLCVYAVGSVAARGELLAVALGAWSAAAFLRGRQERRPTFSAAGLGLCVLGGFASSSVVGLPFVLTIAELFSAHRYRSLRVRLRTSLTTLLVFGAGALLHVVLAVGRDGLAGLPPWVQALRRAGDDGEAALLATRAVEKLGILVLPSNPHVWGIAGTALAGVLFLVAMQPALGAARTAPRLWGWLLFVWFSTLLGTELLHAHADVSARSFEAAGALLPSMAVMAVGLGISATAVSGLPRLLLPALVVGGYAALLHGCGLPWGRAGREVAAMRSDLLGARETYGRDVPILVVDPPARTQGLDPLGGALAELIDPRLVGEPDGGAAGSVRPVSREAFLAFTREPEFGALRRASVVVLTPLAGLAPRESPPPHGRRPILLTEPVPPAASALRTWRGDPRSPALDLDALAFEGLRIGAPAGTSIRGSEHVFWRSVGTEVRECSWPGTWLEALDQPAAVFDLGASLAWRLGGRVRLVWFEGELVRLTQASFLEHLPPVGAGGPESTDEDWLFEPPGGELVPRDARFALGLLDLAGLTYRELDVEQRRTGRLRVRGAVSQVAELFLGGGPVAWYLDCRVGDLTVARDRGRLTAEARD